MPWVLRVSAVLIALLSVCGRAGAQEDDATIQLSLTHTHAPMFVAVDCERLFLDVNAARAAHGLPPLDQDSRLDTLAWQLAQDMAERRYFGHTDPNGVTFDQRIRASGIHYHTAEENIAFDQDEVHAHQAFLHSPGHYENIMNASVRRMGIAVVDAGPGEVFYVEEFAG